MAKGGQFERTIAKQLSLWFSKKKRDDLFWRTAGSGARATTRMKKNIDTANSAGDLGFLHHLGKPFIDLCIIEIKRGYNKKKAHPSANLSVLSLLDVPKGRKRPPVLWRWVDKAEKERKEHKRKYSLIIFRRDRHNACICMQKKTFTAIEKRNIKLFIFPHCGTWLEIQKDNYHVIIFSLEDFLKWCKPSSFFRKIKRK